MKIERCLESKKICLLNDEDNIILETERIGAEFVIIFYTNKPVIITKELDKSLYQNLNNLFENEYIFYKNLSYKNKNNISWISDQYYDEEDLEELEKVNRLVIEKSDEQIKLSVKNIFCQKNNIIRKNFVIAFSPSGNGLYSKNIETGLSFQDDVIIAFYNTLKNEFENNKTYKKCKNKYN